MRENRQRDERLGTFIRKAPQPSNPSNSPTQKLRFRFKEYFLN